MNVGVEKDREDENLPKIILTHVVELCEEIERRRFGLNMCLSK